MKDKVYCQNCIYCEKFMSGASASCDATKSNGETNAFMNKETKPAERVRLSENKTGDCSYYIPTFSVRIKGKIKELLNE